MVADRSWPKNGAAGFSLVELLICMTVLLAVLGIVSGIVSGVQRNYSRQRPRTEALGEASLAMDTLLRLIRMAGNNPNNIAGLQAITPGTPVGGQYRTIRICSDWNPSDGDLNDRYEDITFSIVGGRLVKQESPADTVPVEFLATIGALVFTYYDNNGVLITNPVADSARIARVQVQMTTNPSGADAMTFTSSADLRMRE